MYINNQLQTTVGQKAMVELRSRVEGLKVRNCESVRDLVFNKAATLAYMYCDELLNIEVLIYIL